MGNIFKPGKKLTIKKFKHQTKKRDKKHNRVFLFDTIAGIRCRRKGRKDALY